MAASRQVSVVVAGLLLACSLIGAHAQPTLQKLTFWRRDNETYGLARHTPTWSADKLRNGDTDTFNDDLYDADMSDMTKGNKIGYQAGTCTLTSTAGDGSDRYVYICYSIFAFDAGLIGEETTPNSIETDIITCQQISTFREGDTISLETLVITGGGGKYFGAQGVMHHDEIGGVFEAYYYLPYDVSVDPKGLVSMPTNATSA
ncbi:hypothetical protein KFL_000200090 [Klebsormidium nitens]|uniref:Dirigent protein n=1 Tax=Klebsormidium nitens TaxID=105231 RepID=A0A1Y1HQL8_KLENI|nr:hypothetical protein KFL_000200090 [Klebsormidium nitens]|eukprot:GAQ78857.1 hypothetical protein KFL_000200090 [Klebsormidium nitens]